MSEQVHFAYARAAQFTELGPASALAFQQIHDLLATGSDEGGVCRILYSNLALVVVTFFDEPQPRLRYAVDRLLSANGGRLRDVPADLEQALMLRRARQTIQAPASARKPDGSVWVDRRRLLENVDQFGRTTDTRSN